MDFKEFVFGRTLLDNPMTAYRSQNLYNDKWLYLMGGIHGEEVEGIYLIKELIPWLKETMNLAFPCLLIQNIDVDGYVFQNQGLAKKTNLNNLFPTSSFRMLGTKKIINPDFELRPEIASLVKLFTDYPPQMVISFRTAHHSSKVISVGADGLSLASYLSNTTNSPLVADNKPSPGTLEAFIYDFFLCPVVSVRLPHFSDQKTVQAICQEIMPGIKQLLTGQVY